MTRTLLALVGLATGTAVAACDDLFAPEPNPSFAARPDTVFAGDRVELAFTLRNEMPWPVTILSSSTCLIELSTFRGEQRVPWKGTDYGCGATFTEFTVPPRDSLHDVHRLVAVEVGRPAGNVLPAGTYRIRARSSAALPDLEAEVTVLAPLTTRGAAPPDPPAPR